MKKSKTKIISNILIGVVAVVLILAGTLKLGGIGAEDMVQGLEKARLIQHLTLVSILSIACGILLLIPMTKRLGFLMASSYWGGAIKHRTTRWKTDNARCSTSHRAWTRQVAPQVAS